ncbi:sn-glycerol-3-phosphate ABC transporter ATP-binding protein UgpC [Pseudooceanicola sp. CBS1P-1]|uniref:sn-glycerol-3-phosphate ABC transporter ATP-binding protein UgpC n=1 Tax=Pseudooceanicola albus TaxID=2692189 RepID=A0A6L7G439_9RHOB|nr:MULTISPECIES: sn-glycerol-3-phosphate ABC transporter ATP-binding protein UgpC [Pseudooceanicola]MBT9385079.1 sn-glycerol-3-phosphate ABC transporter ATP-binding protein UgpC [Pseudooceanicola endophyticus]MXN18629.1 sn-glycerol-3-phosphate ABC transporter ATP-binding protein UgpC [Pseudooceanicola albus]
MAQVRLASIGKTYEGATANTIRGLDLEVQDGEFLVLVGPSGCGKSTTLRMIAGLEEPTEGAIWIGNRRVDGLEPRERDIAMVFQNYALYPHMTVAQNMSFGLRLAKVPKPEIRRRVEAAAETLGLSALLGRHPKALSGGQRQRVAMGRAIVREPGVFLFDEPLSNLDAQLRGQMRAEIRRLHDRLSATTVYVTHDQVEAMTLADRVVVLKDGRIEQQGTPQELYDRPATRFVAGFLGSPQMNFLAGEVRQGALDLGAGLVLALPPGHALAEGRKLDVGIRPEAFAVAAPGAAILSPRADLVELLGATSLVHFSHADQPCTALVPPAQAPRAGAVIGLTLAPDRISLFDAETGRAV